MGQEKRKGESERTREGKKEREYTNRSALVPDGMQGAHLSPALHLEKSCKGCIIS